MQVSIEDVSSVKKVLRIEIPEDVVTREMDSAYRELKKTAKIKGFRPGKAPRQVLERHYGKDVNADVTSRLIQDSFASAVQDNALKIVGSPKIDPPELVYKKPYTFEATVEITPELSPIDFKGLSLQKTRYTVMDEEVDAQLKMLQKNMTRYETVETDRAVEAGDWVVIDYEGFNDGQPYEPTQRTENFSMKIGSAQIHQTMDDQLVGCRPGDSRSIEVVFADDHKNKDLAGRTLRFDVTLKEIRTEIVPPIDDELAKKLGSYETIDQVKEEIVKNLTHGYDKRIEQELNEQIFSTLIERNDFEVPDAMVDYELDGIIADAERSFSYHNMSLEQVGMTRDILRERYRETAVKQVKRHLLLGKIMEQENLSLNDEELDAGMAEMAASFGRPVDEIKAYYSNPENSHSQEYLRHTLLEKKAIKLIINSGNVTEVDPVKSERETESGDVSAA